MLIVLIGTNSFAARINDIDKSAFITKSEYDSLVTDYRSRIDKSYVDIDNKIDQAISSYIAGITVNKDSINYYDMFVRSSGTTPIFYQGINEGVDSVNAFNLNGNIHIYGKVCNNLFCYEGYGGSVSDTQLQIGGNHGQGSGNNNYVWYRWYGTSGVVTTDLSSISLSRNTNYNSSSWPPSYGYKVWDKVITQISNGSGARWLAQQFGSFICLKYYCTNFYINNQVNYDSYYYFYKQINETDKNAYLSNNGKAVTGITLPSYTVTPIAGQTVVVGNAKVPSDESSDVRILYRSTVSKTTDGVNYLDAFWSVNSDVGLYVYDENYQGELSTNLLEYTVNAGTYEDVYYKANGVNAQTNNYGAYTFNYYPIILKDSSDRFNLSNFCNRTCSSLMGEPVHHGGGMPIVKTLEDGKRIEIKIKLVSASNANCLVKIASTQFNLGTCPSNKLLAEGHVTANDSDFKTFTVDLNDKGYIWLWLMNETDGNPIVIADLDIKDVH